MSSEFFGTRHVDADEFEALLADLCAEFDAEIYKGYSGRFMYGSRCWGVTVAPRKVEALSASAVSQGLGKPCVDSLGLDAIVYWPAHESNAETLTLTYPEWDEDDEWDEEFDEEYA